MIAIVDIMGGFGNQLFQFSLAKLLQDKGLKVYMFIEDKHSVDRRLVISEDNFKIKRLSKIQLMLLTVLKKVSLKNIFIKFMTTQPFL